ncbi:MAG: hypothetical protein IKL32_07240, partial [Alphaproteobacteria bacterium]|nr:hypothetical protein [Alphaproteobacteria bacterium]
LTDAYLCVKKCSDKNPVMHMRGVCYSCSTKDPIYVGTGECEEVCANRTKKGDFCYLDQN